MFKVVIADDEPIICRGLKKMIETADEDFKVTEIFLNGESLLGYLKENDVDVVFTDIMMDAVSGLDIAEYLNREKPYISCVILSGYEKFEYAKKALEYGVKSYLSKPLIADELEKTLKSLKKKLNPSDETSYVSPTDYDNFIIRQFVTDILTGTLNTAQNINSNIPDVSGCKIDCSLSCAFLNFNITNYSELLTKWKYSKEQLYTSIHNFIIRQFSDIPYLIYTKDCNFLMAFFNINDKEIFNEEFNSCSASFKDIFETTLECDIVFKNDVYDIYNDSEILAIFSNYHANKKIIPDIMITKLNSDDYSEAEIFFNSLVKNRENEPFNDYCSFILNLFSEIFSKLSEIGINLPQHIYQNTNYYAFSSLENIEAVNNSSLSILNQIFNNLKARKNTDSTIIDKVIEYISKHISEDISLDDVSSYVYLNPIYFSRFFKKATGENFSSYLTRIRIEKAKLLLKNTDLKVYQIGEDVGFRSIYYFNRVFKQITGVTPKEFRKADM